MQDSRSELAAPPPTERQIPTPGPEMATFTMRSVQFNTKGIKNHWPGGDDILFANTSTGIWSLFSTVTRSSPLCDIAVLQTNHGSVDASLSCFRSPNALHALHNGPEMFQRKGRCNEDEGLSELGCHNMGQSFRCIKQNAFLSGGKSFDLSACKKDSMRANNTSAEAVSAAEGGSAAAAAAPVCFAAAVGGRFNALKRAFAVPKWSNTFAKR